MIVGPSFGFDGLPLVGVMFFPSSSLWELCCSLAMPIDGTVLGNVFGGGGYFKGKTLKSRFLCPFFFLLYSFLSLSLFLTLSPSLSLSLLLLFLFPLLVVFALTRSRPMSRMVLLIVTSEM